MGQQLVYRGHHYDYEATIYFARDRIAGECGPRTSEDTSRLHLRWWMIPAWPRDRDTSIYPTNPSSQTCTRRGALVLVLSWQCWFYSLNILPPECINLLSQSSRWRVAGAASWEHKYSGDPVSSVGGQWRSSIIGHWFAVAASFKHCLFT